MHALLPSNMLVACYWLRHAQIRYSFCLQAGGRGYFVVPGRASLLYHSTTGRLRARSGVPVLPEKLTCSRRILNATRNRLALHERDINRLHCTRYVYIVWCWYKICAYISKRQLVPCATSRTQDTRVPRTSDPTAAIALNSRWNHASTGKC